MAEADPGERPGGGGAPPLVLDQIEARLFFLDRAPPPYPRVWMTPPLPPAPFIWSSGSATEWGGEGT